VEPGPPGLPRPDGGAPGVLAGIGLLLTFALALSFAWTTLGLLMRTPHAVMSAATAGLIVCLVVAISPDQWWARRPGGLGC
jgi:hypothetical protein